MNKLLCTRAICGHQMNTLDERELNMMLDGEDSDDMGAAESDDSDYEERK